MKAEQQAGFDKFWKEHWPACRRIEKKKAADIWARIPVALYAAIYAAVDRQKKLPGWSTGDCKFVPYAYRWLRDRRWEDEVSLPEDKDVEILIGALTCNGSVPPDFPKHIMARFRKLCERQRVNWPLLHHRLDTDPDVGEKIKADYLATV